MRHRAIQTLAAAAAIVVTSVAIGGGDALPVNAADPPNSGAVRIWNQHAIDALMNPTNAGVPGLGLAPNIGGLHLGIVQGAVYDAVNSIVGGHQPLIPGVPQASPDASLDAAVATAAHHVLDELFADVEPDPRHVGNGRRTGSTTSGSTPLARSLTARPRPPASPPARQPRQR